MNKDTTKTAFLYTGTLIGAGFASGSELAVYFLNKKGNFIITLAISCFIFAVFGKIVIDTAIKMKKYCYREFMSNIVGEKISGILCFFTGIFFFVLFAAMVSAFCSMTNIFIGKGSSIGRIIFIAACIPVLLNGTNGLIKANCFLVPVLIVGIVLCSIAAFFKNYNESAFYFCLPDKSALFSGLNFAFYNMVSCVPVLVECSSKIKSENSYGCVLTAIIVFILGCLMGFCIILSKNSVKSEIPMLFITSNVSKFIYIVYAVSFSASVYTTAAGNGYCALEWFFEGNKISFIKFVAFLIFTYIFSFFSFSVFVEKMYSVFSFIGILEFVFILLYYEAFNIKTRNRTILKKYQKKTKKVLTKGKKVV